MDIERLSRIGSSLDIRLKRKKGSSKSKSGRTGEPSFEKVLDLTDNETRASEILSSGPIPALEGTETVEELLDEVHQKGEALRRDPVFGPLDGYKTAVRHFLRYIIDKGLEVDDILGIRNPKTMSQKKYVIIRVVDEKLDSLAAHVLKGQTDQIEILRRIDEIHGLLVDLTG